MKNFIIILFLFFSVFLNSQIRDANGFGKISNKSSDTLGRAKKTINEIKEKPPIDLYKIYTLQKDTTYLDTTLSIQKEYKFNLLRKDIFGLLPFANEGHTYNTLNYSLVKKNVIPSMGFSGKHFNYLEVDDIKYYNVPTPLSDLYFKTVMEQGQSVDAFLTVNTKPNLNFSIAYKGLRSIGKYINNIASSGNFRFTTSYFTKDKRYILNAHFTGQDISNQENGGIQDVTIFETSEPPFNERERLDVYFNDATSLLKGNRFLIDHSFKLNKSNPNSLLFTHQFNHEYKFFNFEQTIANDRFGDSYSSFINNKTRYNHFYNKIGVGFTTKKYGDVSFFIEDDVYNYFYKSLVFDNVGNTLVPNAINDRITSLGGNYTYYANNLKANLLLSNSITDQSVSNIEATLNYKLNEDYEFQFKYQKLNSLPNLNYTLYQSNYVDYNWFNNFKNEKRNQFQFTILSKWLNLEGQYSILDDYLYFDNITNDIEKLTVKPFQNNNTITYAAVKASKDIKFWKFGLDNTLLYQNVENSDKTLNVPQLVTRNSLYFSEHVFKKAMFIQTGIVFNYFTEYYANDYNPLLGEFYVQSERKIGGFPMIDFFINAKVRQARIFLKAEHFNSAMTGYNFYSAPNYPYRDFIVRFGIVWNFFQ
ncbi:putative porin [Flavobacterium jejuense]|uniref:Porin n=1 Tax=Flavobacterium jejuense TaxID=1544455 RepID=A0ABX0INK9_9FLAO|nr:putative porin [Flavobacterium jejuense]NHN25370.1 putative porin [Flavobacterium jejuense]